MNRICAWIMVGMFGLSLMYLFSSHPLTEPGGRDQASGRLTAPERLNLNTASVEELDGLPGLGPVIVQRIVDYREHHGRFQRPEDLLIIEGIGEKKYQALSDLVRAE